VYGFSYRNVWFIIVTVWSRLVTLSRARSRTTDGGATDDDDDDGRTDGDDDDDDDGGGGGGGDARVDRAWVDRGRADGGDATRTWMADGGARERERGGQVSSAVRANEARGGGSGRSTRVERYSGARARGWSRLEAWEGVD